MSATSRQVNPDTLYGHDIGAVSWDTMRSMLEG